MGHLAAAVMVLVMVTLPEPVAAAASPGRDPAVVCTVDPFPLSISPGLTVAPTPVSFATTSPAVVHCQGRVNGRKVTGPGSLSVQGTMSGPAGGASCARADGKGRGLFTLPTVDGPVEMINTFTFEAITTAGVFRGDALSGMFIFGPPVEGDCVTAPLTSTIVTIVGAAP